MPRGHTHEQAQNGAVGVLATADAAEHPQLGHAVPGGHSQHRGPAPPQPATDRSDGAGARPGRQPFAQVHLQTHAARLDRGRLPVTVLVGRHRSAAPRPGRHLALRQAGRVPGLAQDRIRVHLGGSHRAE